MSVRSSTFNKYEAERLRYTVNYSRWVGEGEILDDWIAEISPATFPAPLVADGAFTSVDNLSATIYLSGGTPDTIYTVSFIAETTQGQIKRDDILLKVI